MDLITQAEAARLKGVSRQRINTLIKTNTINNYNGKVDKQEILNLKPKKSGRKPKTHVSIT